MEHKNKGESEAYVSQPSNIAPDGVSASDPTVESLAGLYTSVLINHQDEQLLAQIKQVTDRWLAWQCQMIAGLYKGAVFLGNDVVRADLEAFTIYPRQSNVEELASIVAKVKRSRKSERICKVRDNKSGRTSDYLAAPVIFQESLLAVVAVDVSTRPSAQSNAIANLLEWGSMWLETILVDTLLNGENDQRFRERLVGETLSAESVEKAAQILVDGLADQFSCQRVSVGLKNGLETRLVATSCTRSFDARSAFATELTNVVSESIDQAAIVAYPFYDSLSELGDANRHFHGAWSKHNDNVELCTIPLVIQQKGQAECLGAVTLERPRDSRFFTKDIDRVSKAIKNIGSIIFEKRQAQKPLRSILMGRLRENIACWSPFQLSGARLAAVAFSAVTVASMLIPVDYRVKAPATVEAQSKQVLTAAFDGYLLQADFRAGDRVQEGQLLAGFDNTQLYIELEKWNGEIDKKTQEYHEALSAHRRSDVSILRAGLEQLRAEKALIEEKINQSELRAPFDGVLVSGDLTQSLGKPVATGDRLFELAPEGSYKLRVEVEEFDIGSLAPGSTGELMLTALPSQRFSFSLQQILPTSVAETGRNYFPASAELEGEIAELRPGMGGIARIDAGTKSLFWVWTHELIDRIKLWYWEHSW